MHHDEKTHKLHWHQTRKMVKVGYFDKHQYDVDKSLFLPCALTKDINAIVKHVRRRSVGGTVYIQF